jgi:hypothetical protein
MVSIWPTANTPIDYTSAPYTCNREENLEIQPGTLLEFIYTNNPTYFNLLLKSKMYDYFNNPSNHFTFIMTPEQYMRSPRVFEKMDPIFAHKIVNYSILPERIVMADFGTLDEGMLRTNLPMMNLNYKMVDKKLYINGVPVIQTYARPSYTLFLVENTIFKLH